MDKIGIIIPTYKNELLTIRCIESVRMHTKISYEILWIDDCSPLSSFNKVMDFLSSSDILFRSFRFAENKGPASTINQGIRMSRGEYVAILNNDVVVTEGWLNKLIDALCSSKRIGLVGTVTNKASSVCRYDKAAKTAGYEVPQNPEGFFNNLPARTIPVTSNISYFCMAIKKEMIKKVGLLDERFYMGAEDDDYNDRIRAAGYETVLCINCFIYHDHHATLDLIPGIQERRKQNVILLRQKRMQRIQEKQ